MQAAMGKSLGLAARLSGQVQLVSSRNKATRSGLRSSEKEAGMRDAHGVAADTTFWGEVSQQVREE